MRPCYQLNYRIRRLKNDLLPINKRTLMSLHDALKDELTQVIDQFEKEEKR